MIKTTISAVAAVTAFLAIAANATALVIASCAVFLTVLTIEEIEYVISKSLKSYGNDRH
ncbi:MAG: hypothetical protein K2L83_05105 [Muribaculaceae bacterium]|nr:hypothetical protein [Muribaculaceae bacterium]